LLFWAHNICYYLKIKITTNRALLFAIGNLHKKIFIGFVENFLLFTFSTGFSTVKWPGYAKICALVENFKQHCRGDVEKIAIFVL
jgi:hypothetical protein